jgi:molybdate transport system substrate-binding protein
MLPRVLCLAVLALAVPSTPPAPVMVFAATSLTDVLDEIGTAYSSAGGGAVRFNFAGSNTLARQIIAGAPADVFVSADEVQMDVVQKAGLIVDGSRVDVVSNQLVVASLAERAEAVRATFAKAPPQIARLAIGDSAAVPAGVYARRYLEAKGLWTSYEPRIVPTANVRAALVAVENGAADAAIVYATDMAIARGAVAAFTIPLDQSPRIVYPAALLKTSTNAAEARQWLSFVAGAQAAEIFRRHKFLPVTRH